MEDKKNKTSRRAFIAGFVGLFAGFSIASISISPLQRLTSLWFRIANNPKTLTNVEVKLYGLAKGETMAVTWQGETIYVLRRTDEIIASMKTASDDLYYNANSKGDALPNNFDRRLRSSNPEYLIVNGMCTHLGCPTTPVMPETDEYFTEGGFFCGCHGGRFDFSGRVLAGTPPPKNLKIPPYHFKDEHTLVIGQGENG